MAQDRWTSGLAKDIAHQTTGLVLDPAERHADAVEELINSCVDIDSRLAALARVSPEMGVESSPAVLRFRAALSRAKGWSKNPDYDVVKCPECGGDGFITLPGIKTHVVNAVASIIPKRRGEPGYLSSNLPLTPAQVLLS